MIEENEEEEETKMGANGHSKGDWTKRQGINKNYLKELDEPNTNWLTLFLFPTYER